MYGSLSKAQREVLGSVLKGQKVTDLGAGNCLRSLELLDLGAAKVIAIDKEPANPQKRQGFTFVRSYFADYKGSRPDVAFLSWPPNHTCPGLLPIVKQAPMVIYLGKNTDGTACGSPELFWHLTSLEVIHYIPDRINTLIVYGNKQVEREPRGEERAALEPRACLRYEQVEGLVVPPKYHRVENLMAVCLARESLTEDQLDRLIAILEEKG